MRKYERTGSILRLLEHGAFVCSFVFLVLLVWGVPSSIAFAQRHPGTVGLGAQIGGPSGVTLKVYRSSNVAYDGVITTDADDFLSARVHRLWERPLPDSPLHLFFGPGLLLGAEQLRGPPRVRLGLSSEIGLNFYSERFEVFLHVTPTLRFVPNTKAHLDGNVGLRYYFRVP